MSDVPSINPVPGYRLVMPFVTVRSNGGPHDDASYVAGWEAATLDARCGLAARYDLGGFCAMVRADNVAQADLIAMKHGMVMTTEAGGVDGWEHLHFAWPDDDDTGANE